MNEDAHPAGHYEAHPEVTYDLAEERWLGTKGRSDVLIANCRSCGWQSEGEQVPANPERQREAAAIIMAKHWYECPCKPDVKFRWVAAAARAYTGRSMSCRVYHRMESGPFVQLRRCRAPHNAAPLARVDYEDSAFVPTLSLRGKAIFRALIARGFTPARALPVAKLLQVHSLASAQALLERARRREQS